MTRDTLTPVQALKAALMDKGAQPIYHAHVENVHRQQWPTLWRAIDRVVAGDGEESTMYPDQRDLFDELLDEFTRYANYVLWGSIAVVVATFALALTFLVLAYRAVA